MEKKTLIALAALLALGFGAVVVMRSPEKGDRQAPPPRPVAELKAAEVTHLELTSQQQGKLALERDGEAWRVKSPQDWPAEASAVKAVLDGLEKLSFGDVVSETAAKHGDLQVAEGSGARVVAKGAGGKVLADLFVGRQVGGFAMIRPAGQDRVWQGNGMYDYQLNRTATDFRDHVVFQFAAADATKLTVEEGPNRLVLEREASPEAAKADPAGKAAAPAPKASWKLVDAVGEGPRPGELLDVAMADAVAQTMGSLRATDFADDKTAVEAGLDKPRLTVTVATKDGKTHTLLLGGAQGEDRFGKAGDRDTRYLFKKYLIERLARRPADYRDKTLVEVPEAEVQTVEISTGGETAALEREGSGWKLRQGGPIDGAGAKALVSAFEHLQGSGFAPSKDAATTGLGKPLGVITLTRKDQQKTTLRVGALTADQGDYHVQRQGSPEVLLVKKPVVDRFLKKRSELLADAAKPPPSGPPLPR